MIRHLRADPAPAFCRVGRAVKIGGACLAFSCLVVGAAFATFVQASVEQRISGLFLFGLIPAFGFYAGGCVLYRTVVLSCMLCEFTVMQSLQRLPALAYALRRAIVGAFCLLIRTAARFLIGIQSLFSNLRRWNLVAHLHRDGATAANRHGRRLLRLRGRASHSVVLAAASLATFGCGWIFGLTLHSLVHQRQVEATDMAALDTVVGRIIGVESNGDANAKNKRSSATGLGQFLSETWLDMIRAYRPELTRGRSQDEILELRRDADLSREITARFAERNAAILKRRGLPVTAGTVYLAHFAGGAGAVAILSAPEDADAALVMASADATGRTRREKIVKANPFLEHFTVADLKNWADRKMIESGAHLTEMLAANAK